MSLVDYLPHSLAIVLIDEVLEFRPNFIKTRSMIKDDNKFLQDGKFAMHKSIEMMAQALGVYDSKMRELRGMKSGLGFLLGSRKFEMFEEFLKVGDEAIITAVCSIQDEQGFGVYDCELCVDDRVVARACLSVMSPSEEFVKRMIDE